MNKIPKKAGETFKLYYDDDIGAYIIDYYKNESIPLNGWLKHCINCYAITSKYVIFDYMENKKIAISLCPRCNKNIKYKRINLLMDKINKNNKCKFCLC
jgi:hypothetical protein